jgi:hypothetical protein
MRARRPTSPLTTVIAARSISGDANASASATVSSQSEPMSVSRTRRGMRRV